MAQVFKNYTQASIGTSTATVYTVTGATTSIVIGCITILLGVFLATSKKIKKIEGQAHAK